jgi:hypothetical protein
MPRRFSRRRRAVSWLALPGLAGMALAGIVLAGGAVAAQAPGLAMLRTLDPGLWELRDRDSSGEPLQLCLGDAKQLLQPRHRNAICTRFVVENGESSVTVQYSCPGAGSGRTTIRRETARLAQIDTQGFAGDAPFNASYEARRIGTCR